MTRILLLYNRIIPSVRLCALETFSYIDKLGLIEFRYVNIYFVTRKDLLKSDVIVFVRADGIMEKELAKLLKESKKYLIYILDDDILNVPEGLSSSKHYRSDSTKNNIIEIMKCCNCLMSTSRLIIEKYGYMFCKNVLIDEPALFLPVNNCFHEKADNKIKIGFAGSIDRTGDIETILGETIKQLINKYKDKIDISFYGAKPNFINLLNLTHIPYTENYDEYRNIMRGLCWDIGLAPMPDTSFHNSKYFNKYIEYGACGIVGVYSNLPPYKYVVEDGIKGLLCSNSTQEWVNAISNLIDKPYLLENIKVNMLEDIKNRFSVEAVSQRLISNLPEIFEFSAPKKNIKYIGFLKARCLIAIILGYFKRNGLYTFVKVAKKLNTRKG